MTRFFTWLQKSILRNTHYRLEHDQWFQLICLMGTADHHLWTATWQMLSVDAGPKQQHPMYILDDHCFSGCQMEFWKHQLHTTALPGYSAHSQTVFGRTPSTHRNITTAFRWFAKKVQQITTYGLEHDKSVQLQLIAEQDQHHTRYRLELKKCFQLMLNGIIGTPARVWTMTNTISWFSFPILFSDVENWRRSRRYMQRGPRRRNDGKKLG